jgi:hypothetical protein
MTKQVINIGVEGNDATGDAIREAFSKTNSNFNELYAYVGKGGGIAFTSLEDAPHELVPNNIFIVDPLGNQILSKSLVAGDGVSIDNTDPNQIIFNNTGARLSSDNSPALGNHLNANTFNIFNLANPDPIVAQNTGSNIDSHAINKGYADSRYVNSSGDTMTGGLVVPAGATGSQVPRVSEVVQRAGDSMSGPLLLSSDPLPSSDPLTAATKNYVDTSSFSSQVNLFVSVNGSDFNLDTPSDKRGRALAYAFKTINRACREAQRLIDAAGIELGPYQKPVFNGDSITRSTVSAVTHISGNSYYLDITHSGFGTDMRKGSNYDIRSGLLLRGASSGDIGRIDLVGTVGVSTERYQILYINLDSSDNPITYIIGEQLEYGEPSKLPEIAIMIESGEYFEHLPIKVPTNVSLVGDEFRRVIVRPRTGPSASIWSNTFFRRDPVIDGLTVATSTFGRHYLTNESTGIYSKTITSPGSLTNARILLSSNRDFIAAEVIGYINSHYPSFTYNQDLCYRDVGLIVDCICHDLEYGGYAASLQAGISYFQGKSTVGDPSIAIGTQLTETTAGINYIYTLANKILSNLPPTNGYQTSVTQVFLSDDGESGSATAVQSLIRLMIDIINLDSSFNFPKNNNNIDIFLLNNATSVRELSAQGHGGFMCVLDPEGQIVTKSPYMLTCTSTSRSINAQIFAGGMFVDGSSGNLQATVITRTSSTVVQVSGLVYREPQTPCSFFINGVRYQVDSISNYDPQAGTAQLNINPNTPDDNSYTQNGIQITASLVIELGTAGNRSMVCSHFTQIDDLGYGLFATNTGLIEAVSVFTYYCYRAYYSLNGSIIRSLNGSNAYGTYALTAEGSDPTEAAENVNLANAMTQLAQAYTQGAFSGNNLQNDIILYVYNFSYEPYDVSELEIDHSGIIVRYEINNITETATPGVIALNLSTSGNNNTSTTGLYATVANNTYVVIRNLQNFRFSSVTNTTPIRPSTALTFNNESDIYRIYFYNTSGQPSQTAILRSSSSYNYVKMIADTTAGTGAGTGQTGDTKIRILALSVSDQTRVVGHVFGWGSTLHTVTGYETPAQTGNTWGRITVTPALGKTTAQTSYNNTQPTLRAGWGTTKNIPITSFARASNIATIITTAAHGLTNGDTVTVSSLSDSSFNVTATVTVVNTTTFTYSNAGAVVTTTLTNGVGAVLTAKPIVASITVLISIVRANGHDLLSIGTGGFADTNYPNNIFGPPNNLSAQANEVKEVNKGRVFYATTDQDGNFRVGSFFKVDQGTGTVTFSASIALSNLDGIGFKRGVTVAEFSPDDSMANNAVDTVPVQSAVRSYVDRRLGISQTNGNPVTNPIGPGFIARDGSLGASANISLNSYRIINLSDPTTGSDAATKSYVDLFLKRSGGTRSGVDEFTMSTSTTLAVTNVARSTNVATITTNYPHALSIGSIVTVSGVSFVNFDAAGVTVTAVPSSTTFTYANTGTTLASTAATGSVIVPSSIGMNGNKITGLLNPTAAQDAATKSYVDALANPSIGNLSDVSLTGIANNNMLAYNGSRWVNAAVTGDVTISLSGNTVTSTIGAGKITNSMLNASAAIDQSKLNLNNATAAATSGAATFGISAYSNTNFSVSSGFVTIKSAGISLSNITSISNGTVLGNNSGVTSSPSEVNFSSSNTANSLVYRDASGNFSAGVITGTATQARYADLAENYKADQKYEVGTVVMLGGEEEVTLAKGQSTTKVAGVVSGKPAHLMNSDLESEFVAAVALQGRVPCRVIGKVTKGDLMVVSMVPGVAMSEEAPKVGSVIGKALANYDSDRIGIIEVLVGKH